MKKPLQLIAPVVLGLSFLSTAVWAQTPAASAPASGTAMAMKPKMHGHRQAMHGDGFVEKRLASLHSDLQITAAQEPQWNTFAQTMRDSASKTQAAYAARDQKTSSMTADESMQSFADLTQLHADNTKALSTAFSALYATFSDVQKQHADTMFRDQQMKRKAAMKAHHSKAPKDAPATAAEAPKPASN